MKKALLFLAFPAVFLLGALCTYNLVGRPRLPISQGPKKDPVQILATNASSTEKITTSDLAHFFNKRVGPCTLKGTGSFDCFTDQFVVSDKAVGGILDHATYTFVDFPEPGYAFHGVFVTIYWGGTASSRSVYALMKDPENGSLVVVYARPDAAFDTQTPCVYSRGPMWGTCFIQTHGDDGRYSGTPHPSIAIPVQWDAEDRVFFENDR